MVGGFLMTHSPAKGEEKDKLTVLNVGDVGLGFVVEGTYSRYVITAVSCLPCSSDRDWYDPDERDKYYKPTRLDHAVESVFKGFERLGHVLRPPIPEPQCWPPLSWHSRKHPIPRLLAPFGKKPAVAAQCIFLDPISGLAVLESPRYSEYRGHEEGKAFEALMASVSPLRVSDVASSSKRNDEESDEWHEWREATVWLRLRTGEPLICTATYLKETPHENLLISENIPYGS